jgi:cyclic pyranopterin phosphate synthase
MPLTGLRFLPRDELLTYEEIERFVRILAAAGIRTLRLTGGEPLVRRDLDHLIRKLVVVPGIESVALTTNGLLLAEQAASLRAAGLDRLNVSLDAIDPETFRAFARRDGLDRVLLGLEEAQRVGFRRIKINAVAVRGLSEDQIVPLVRFGREHGYEVRFIEFMPLDAEGRWDDAQVIPGDEILARLTEAIGPLVPKPRPHPSQPATDYTFADGRGGVGLINPVSQPFCEACNRLRITAEGQLRNCLFSQQEWDIRQAIRAGQTDEEVLQIVQDCVAHKRPGHGIGEDSFVRPERAMYQIGG